MSDQPQALQRIDALPLTPQSQTAVAILDVISRAAKDPAVDVEKMERLFALQERMLAKEAEMAFSSDMEGAQREMPIIKNDAKNATTNSSYTRLKTMNALMVPVYTRHGFSLSYGTADCQEKDCVRITCKVSHRAGHSKDYQLDVPLDLTGMKGTPNKTKTHAFGSSLSYGRRYLAALIFNVSTTDDDDGQTIGKRDDQNAGQVAKTALWNLLVEVRGAEPNWTLAKRWLIDECNLAPDTQLSKLEPAGWSELLEKARARMVEISAIRKENQ